MKKKSAIIVAILIMCIGFAAISTTLIINGNAKVSENTDDFSVIFTAASLDGLDVYANVISQDKKTITFETKKLKTLNDSSLLNYEVTNNSANYDAEVSVNCKVKENTTAKYTSIKNELEGNATIVKAKESINGTLTITLNKTSIEEVTEEYTCEIVANAKERDTLGISEPVSFEEDSWSTIAANVQAGNTDKYNVGDTKEIDLGEFGTHTLRLSNKSACTNGETSETACGFVVEFADIITLQKMNSTDTNVGGWPASEERTYINSTIYNELPSDLQNVIVSTKVISGHGSSDSLNFVSIDKLYLLGGREVYVYVGGNGDISLRDTAYMETKQLDYYKNIGVTTANYLGTIKQYNGSNSYWWLRSAATNNSSNFLSVNSNGDWNNYANGSFGISPAFRIA